MVFILEKANTLILSGGGMKGYYYIGIIKYLEQKKILNNINKYAGTSIGAFACLLLVLNYSYQEILNIFYNINIAKLLKISIKNILLNDNWGIYDNKNIIYYIKNIFIYKNIDENITFELLYKNNNKYLGIIATNLSKNKEIIFDYINTPNIKVIDALLASMNLPIIFPKIEINGDLYIDGGFSNNFPINYFSSNSNNIILGIYLKEYSLQNQNITNIFDYIKNIIKYYHHNTGNKHNEIIKKEINNNMYILYPNNLNVESINLFINNKYKKQMIIHGYKCIYNHFYQESY